MKITVKQIVIKYLKANGYDGLAGDECGCSGDGLMDCGGCADCVPGTKIVCSTRNYCYRKGLCLGDPEPGKDLGCIREGKKR
jgi:hypothetical protein